jgi:hypothetical protein
MLDWRGDASAAGVRAQAIPYTMVMMRVGLCLYLPIPFPLPPHLMVAFDVTMVGLGVLATVGFCTRPALLLFAAGYWYMGAAISAWGFFAHDPVAG